MHDTLSAFLLQHHFHGKDFLTFEAITLVPIQKKLIDKSLLTNEEVSAWSFSVVLESTEKLHLAHNFIFSSHFVKTEDSELYYKVRNVVHWGIMFITQPYHSMMKITLMHIKQ